MLTFSKNKKSKFIIFIGWGGKYYTNTINDINNLKQTHGNEKINYKKIEG